MFQKGHPGFKPKGAKAKAGVTVKNAFAQLLTDNMDQLRDDIDKMRPKDRAYFLKDLAEYVLPKLARVQTDLELGDKTRSALRSWTITPVLPLSEANKQIEDAKIVEEKEAEEESEEYED